MGVKYSFWAETAFIAPGLNKQDGISDIWRRVGFLPGNHFLGVANLELAADESEPRAENLAVFVSETGALKGVYRKNLPMPFGETIPSLFEPLTNLFPSISEKIRYIENHTLTVSDSQQFVLPDNSRVIPLICSEIFDRGLVRRQIMQSLEKSYNNSVIYNPSGNFAFVGTNVSNWHLNIARWRAAEFGLPVVYTSNNGPSAIISPWGSILSKTTNVGLHIEMAILPMMSKPKV